MTDAEKAQALTDLTIFLANNMAASTAYVTAYVHATEEVKAEVRTLCHPSHMDPAAIHTLLFPSE